MPGNDQEQFEDYQELEQFIEEMRKGLVLSKSYSIPQQAHNAPSVPNKNQS